MMNRMPIISIVTPTFNCAAYIRDCIESVLMQDYENFEHIIVDGASTDSTVEILQQYPHLHWISEPDSGEGEALNKALRQVRGDIIGWLNADDYYLPGIFHRVAGEIDPQQNRHVVYGNTNFVDEKGNFVLEKRSAPVITLPLVARFWEHRRLFHQPSIFYSKELMSRIGPFNSDLHFSIDYEHWLRTIVEYKFYYVEQTFSCARMLRPEAKSASNEAAQKQSHWKVSLSYHRHLNLGDRIGLWKDWAIKYNLSLLVIKVYCRFMQIRVWFAIGTRLRTLKSKMLRSVQPSDKGKSVESET